MTRHLPCLFLAVVSLIILLSGCSSSLSKDQIQFGIKAARLDLWDEAIFRWKKALQEKPDAAAVHNNLAVAYEKKGRWEEAKEAYDRALKYDPEDKHIKSNHKQFMKRYEAQKDDILEKE